MHSYKSPTIQWQRNDAQVICPRCKGDRIHAKNNARRIGGSVGTVSGAAAGMTGAAAGAETGAAIGMLAGPAGAVLGGVAGAIFGGLFGAAAGGAVGAKAGEVIDSNVLDNFVCLSCGHEFSS